ncbi:MAG: glycoside hydrolase family 57 protein [Phycisphaeraceae bacterium]
MASVCFYFQVHQPYRLRRYSVFDSDASYFDEPRNQAILDRVVAKCYLPATQLLLDLIRKHEGRFSVAFSLTGVILDQFKERHPQVIELLQTLAKTGCVEFLAETYHHSLAFLYSHEEFLAQVDMHAVLMEELLGAKPAVFRNTELIYSNELAEFLGKLGRYRGILSEGVDHVLAGRSANRVYRPPGDSGGDRGLKLLLKNYRLSDDIAFRFSDRGWDQWPLTADKFAGWLNRVDAKDQVCNLFMDFETFGEHQWPDTGIFEFIRALPDAIFRRTPHDIRTPSQCLAEHEPVGVYDVPHVISWADTERDLSAWIGNAMQSNALHELYRMEPAVKAASDPTILRDWRRLTTSDHFYYMCTKYFSDGAVHKYFNPYASPYDSYINFMNVMDHLRSRVQGEGV